MIEKKIYYVWVGNAKKPDIFYKCLESWKKNLPDFEIIEINEKNFDMEKHLAKNKKALGLCFRLYESTFYV